MTETTKTNAKPKKEKRKGRWTRRGFIGAALIVGVAIRPGDRTEKLAKYVTSEGEHLLAAWVKIAEDNTITAIIPHGEMGQGVHTALSAMLAEEMDADWSAL
jgi:isoquinoline 1-oxidoreductase beta subunit